MGSSSLRWAQRPIFGVHRVRREMPGAVTLGKGRAASPGTGGRGMFGPTGSWEREKKEEGAYLGQHWTLSLLPPPLGSPHATPCTPRTANTAWREHPQLPNASSQLHTLPCPTVHPLPPGPAPLPKAPAVSPPSPPAVAAGSRAALGAPGAWPGPWRWLRDPRQGGSGAGPGSVGCPQAPGLP